MTIDVLGKLKAPCLTSLSTKSKLHVINCLSMISYHSAYSTELEKQIAQDLTQDLIDYFMTNHWSFDQVKYIITQGGPFLVSISEDDFHRGMIRRYQDGFVPVDQTYLALLAALLGRINMGFEFPTPDEFRRFHRRRFYDLSSAVGGFSSQFMEGEDHWTLFMEEARAYFESLSKRTAREVRANHPRETSLIDLMRI